MIVRSFPPALMCGDVLLAYGFDSELWLSGYQI